VRGRSPCAADRGAGGRPGLTGTPVATPDEPWPVRRGTRAELAGAATHYSRGAPARRGAWRDGPHGSSRLHVAREAAMIVLGKRRLDRRRSRGHPPPGGDGAHRVRDDPGAESGTVRVAYSYPCGRRHSPCNRYGGSETHGRGGDGARFHLEYAACSSSAPGTRPGSGSRTRTATCTCSIEDRSGPPSCSPRSAMAPSGRVRRARPREVQRTASARRHRLVRPVRLN